MTTRHERREAIKGSHSDDTSPAQVHTHAHAVLYHLTPPCLWFSCARVHRTARFFRPVTPSPLQHRPNHLLCWSIFFFARKQKRNVVVSLNTCRHLSPLPPKHRTLFTACQRVLDHQRCSHLQTIAATVVTRAAIHTPHPPPQHTRSQVELGRTREFESCANSWAQFVFVAINNRRTRSKHGASSSSATPPFHPWDYVNDLAARAIVAHTRAKQARWRAAACGRHGSPRAWP